MKSKLSIILLSLSVIVTASCSKWLDITSKTDIPSEQQFKDVTGFRDAVIGVYVKMAKPELYSQEMTWRTVEFLSQQYAVVAGAPDLNVPLYAYNTNPLPAKRESMWLGAYNVIANINQILRYQEKNREAFSQTPITDSLIKGEMLALRAFIHFDIMRLFGKGNLANRPQMLNELTIPYVTTFSKDATPQRKYSETLELMKNDIVEAIKYLQCDPLSKLRTGTTYWSQELASGFISTTSAGTSSPNRKMRMNYWAAKALYARILMWEGTAASKALALKEALDVIGSSLSGGIGTGDGAYYTWTTSANVSGTYWYTSDLSFVNEHLFTLQVEKFMDIQSMTGVSGGRSWFFAGSPNNQYSVVYVTDARRKNIFEFGTSLIDIDWRATKCLWADGSTLQYWTIAKFYNTTDQSTSYNKRMPLMRISEMYYIAAECLLEPGANYDKAKAVACLNKIRNQRNIPVAYNLSASLTDAVIKNEITKEYLKEFIGEGQLFYYYKRLGLPTIMDYGKEMTDVEYQMPMPDSEVANGGLRQN
jgi:starch-binding outer membrane protein, SusD/RagB family